MKRWIVVALLIAILSVMLCGCSEVAEITSNKQHFDTHFSFDEVIIRIDGEDVVRGKVDSWRDFTDGDQLQVTVNGVTYLTHAENVILIDR